MGRPFLKEWRDKAGADDLVPARRGDAVVLPRRLRVQIWSFCTHRAYFPEVVADGPLVGFTIAFNWLRCFLRELRLLASASAGGIAGCNFRAVLDPFEGDARMGAPEFSQFATAWVSIGSEVCFLAINRPSTPFLLRWRASSRSLVSPAHGCCPRH